MFQLEVCVYLDVAPHLQLILIIRRVKSCKVTVNSPSGGHTGLGSQKPLVPKLDVKPGSATH